MAVAIGKLEDDIFLMLERLQRRSYAGGERMRALTGCEQSNFDLQALTAVLAMIADTRPAAFAEQELQQTVNLFLQTQRADSVFADSLAADGSPVYTESAVPFHVPAVLWLTEAVWSAFRSTGDRTFAESAVAVLQPALEALPRNPKTGLWEAPSSNGEPRQPIFLFRPSLVLAQACHQLSDIFHDLNRDGQADHWQHTGQLIEKSIRIYFWNKKIGMFRQRTALPSLIDIQGSALSVFRKTATSGQLMTIAGQFQNHYREFTRQGAIRRFFKGHPSMPDRESPSALPRECSADDTTEYDTMAAGWFAYTLDFSDSSLADQLTEETIANIYSVRDEANAENSPDAMPLAPSQVPAACRLATAGHAILGRRRKKTATARG